MCADNMKLMTWLLEDAGFAHSAAGSAEEALDLVETKSFDLVLMDISLPGMNGIEATRRLRARPECEHMPVIEQAIGVATHGPAGDLGILVYEWGPSNSIEPRNDGVSRLDVLFTK